MVDIYGDEQVVKWRRTYDSPPPMLDLDDKRHPKFDPRYRDLPEEILPRSESLKNTVDRVLPLWHDVIAKDVMSGKKVLIVCHMNALRALVKHLSSFSEDQILDYNIPTATPLVYEFDENLKMLNNYYLID
jgi:2,3-bisphosphoglycerate-dependent phosphoglycerate mutase